ncbi:hypothetical protein ABW19_dt0200694 [Dactylella cylindrospora]|nr:hypothetical protein ABW19_dt0200694 [Dactylella cylindrospora]
MSIRQGLYEIISPADGDSRLVYRSPIEDLSLRPKPIWALKVGYTARPWVVEKTEKGYILKALGAPVGVDPGRKDMPFAFLIEEWGKDYEWTLEPVQSGSGQAYRIKGKHGLYWTTSQEEKAFGRLIEFGDKNDGPEQIFYFKLVGENSDAQRTKYDLEEEEFQSRFSNGRKEKKFCA